MKKIATNSANRIVTAILAIVLIFSLAVPASAANAFTDTPDWCADAANWAAQQGIASGVGNNKFAPDDPCTNGQIITMLWRAAGSPKASKTFPGTAPDYAKAAMNWAYGKGIIGSSAKADSTCKCAGAVLVIWRAFGSPSASTSTGFSDVKSTDSAAQAITWAVSNGIVAGIGDGKFGPNESCTRGQIVTLLHKAYVDSARLNANNNSSNNNGNTSTPGNGSIASSINTTKTPEEVLKGYGDIETVVKSVSNPTKGGSSDKDATSYGTVDWSTAAQGYITFTASGSERVFVLQAPDGAQAMFDVAKGTTVKAILTGDAGTYQYAIGHNTSNNSYAVDYKNSFKVSKIENDLARYLVSSPYGDYSNAPNAVKKASELWNSSKTQFQNVTAIADWVGDLKYDKSLAAGTIDTYVNPDDVIKNGGGVCNDLSKLLVAMLRSQGVPAYYQTGVNSYTNHAWVRTWVELSSETKNGMTYSTGTWINIDAVDGRITSIDNNNGNDIDALDYAN